MNTVYPFMSGIGCGVLVFCTSALPCVVCVSERESKTLRMCDIHELLHKLPEQNFEMLKILVSHLKK